MGRRFDLEGPLRAAGRRLLDDAHFGDQLRRRGAQQSALGGERRSVQGKLAVYQHGFLRPSADGHYLQYADGTPFFYLGDTHWILPHYRLDTSNAPGVASAYSCASARRVSLLCPFPRLFRSYREALEFILVNRTRDGMGCRPSRSQRKLSNRPYLWRLTFSRRTKCSENGHGGWQRGVPGA
ncbi:DUF4038 domain-containing protein [Kribbella lupini]|uniref:apiosidase-like domain-containing protein n=1 Tax=Kribbella lupini TaxID=291602 RepID=UPI003CD0B381